MIKSGFAIAVWWSFGVKHYCFRNYAKYFPKKYMNQLVKPKFLKRSDL